MKRKTLLFTLALPVITCLAAQAQTASRLIGVTHLANNGASFTPVDSTYYSYSGTRGGDLNHTLKYDNATQWNFLGDTAYSNAAMYLQTFDANNNMLTSIVEVWSGTDWVLSTKNLYTYDGGNVLTKSVQQIWSGSSWVPLSQDEYTYVSGKLVEDRLELWNSLTSAFVNTSQQNFYYDPVSGNKVNTTNITWVGSVPVNQSEYTYTYTGSNKLATTEFSTWNGAGWDPMTMITNTYDSSNNLINTLSQSYDMTTTSWVNQILHTYSNFTTAHDPITDVQQLWDTAGGGMWDNQVQYTNTYNGFNQKTSTVGESWNIVGAFEFALNDPATNYYYETYTSSNVSVKTLTAGVDDASIYPVPAQNSLHIDLNWSKAQAATIAIYDMQGRVVNQWVSDFGTQYRSAVSVNQLAAGTYFVKISGADQQIVKQIVIAH